jgi:hypothetical protein
MSFRSRLLGACIAMALLVLLPGTHSALAQQGTSTLRGTITDQQGATIPGATVTLVNEGMNFRRTQQASEVGAFAFTAVPPGEYDLEVSAQGFKKKIVHNIRALVGAAVDATTSLELGELAQTVSVEATATTVRVNTQDATLGNNFVDKQIAELPMEARNVGSLLTLQAGVTRDGYVAGARSDQSNVTLDGVDVNDAETNDLFSTVLRVNAESLEEFRVNTVNANADQGRSSAAQVNLVTKSGTNSFHGSGFWYSRRTQFTANNFFNNRSGTARPRLERDTYSIALGGPVIKNKLFFFYSYEGRKDESEGSRVNVVPLASMGLGQLRYVDVNGDVKTLAQSQLDAAFPAVKTNPVAIKALADAASRYKANDFTVGDSTGGTLLNTAGFRFNAPTPVDLNSNVAKLDWNVASAHTISIRANAQFDLFGRLPAWPDTPAPNTWSHPYGGAISHTWTINQKLVSSFRYGLTRLARSQQGDSGDNNISFRFIFSPRDYSRTFSRVNPVHNIVEDMTWIKGNHSIQFGANLRFIRNGQVNFDNAYDTAVTNPSYYVLSGGVVSDAVSEYLAENNLPDLQTVSETQNAATALIGRFSQYTARFTFDSGGKLLTSGTARERNFATDEYDFYFQDSWKLRKDLTLNVGVRYGLSRPVYETNGFEVKPNIAAEEYLRRRIAGSSRGVPYLEPMIIDLSGPANGKSPLYNWDKNNFQPRISVAWNPSFESGILKKIFGDSGKSVWRAGFSITNDYFGQALATLFDSSNTLGFTSEDNISANTYNVTNQPAPAFTGFNQAIRTLPKIDTLNSISFPRQQASDRDRRIEGGLDSNLVAPINYSWNLTFERELPAGMVFQTSYMARLGRNMLATRDVMAINNLVDPKTGMDWYTAATALEKIRATRPAVTTKVATIPYFENVFPSNLREQLNDYGYDVPDGFNNTQSIFYMARAYMGNDWTYVQDEIERATDISYFYNPQYGALSAWGTIGNSTYHAMTMSVRQRFKEKLSWDFNYTWSHSLDDASGLQNGGEFGGGFITNPLKQRDNYSSSDFDMRHMINVNGIYQLPFGRGEAFGQNLPTWAQHIAGGWQLSGILRWNTGLPLSAPYDDARWATNWNVQSNVTRTQDIAPCITKGTSTDSPKYFGCNTTLAYQSFRNPYPGETGERNSFRLPSFINLDMGLTKGFRIKEGQRLALKWEVFNVSNTQRFGAMDTSRTGWGLRLDTKVRNLAPPSNWSNFTGIQGSPRVMQFGARYEF